MIIALFQRDNKAKKFYFFPETFLLVDISIDDIFEMSFPNLSNVEVNFNDRKLR